MNFLSSKILSSQSCSPALSTQIYSRYIVQKSLLTAEKTKTKENEFSLFCKSFPTNKIEPLQRFCNLARNGKTNPEVEIKPSPINAKRKHTAVFLDSFIPKVWAIELSTVPAEKKKLSREKAFFQPKRP